jgi:hypothetical protein
MSLVHADNCQTSLINMHGFLNNIRLKFWENSYFMDLN